MDGSMDELANDRGNSLESNKSGQNPDVYRGIDE